MDIKKIFICYVSIVFLLFGISFFKFQNKISNNIKIYPKITQEIDIIIDTKQNFKPIILKNHELYKTKTINSKEIINIKDKISNLEILFDKNLINSLIVFKGNNVLNITKVHSEGKKCINQKCFEFISLNDYLKKTERSDFANIINILCIFYLSLFSFNIYYIIPYALVFIGLYLFKNINFKINHKLFFTIALLSGIILRINNNYGDFLFLDEIETLNYLDLNTFYKDPGNPPFFYILAGLFVNIFAPTFENIKTFTLIISICALIMCWIIAKKLINIKFANIFLFLCSINILLIYYTQQFRSYILQALLTILILYFSCKIINSDKNKYYIFYALIALVASNTHYYEILFIFANFILISLKLIQNKKYLNFKKFILSNIICFVFFLPYFIKTALNYALLSPSFNAWIPKTTPIHAIKCLTYIFGGILSCIISLCCYLKLFIRQRKGKIFFFAKYCFELILITSFLALIISLFRPFLIQRYFVLLIPCFLIFYTCCFYLLARKKTVMFFIIWLFLIQANTYFDNYKIKGLFYIPFQLTLQENSQKAYMLSNNYKINEKFIELSKKKLHNYKNVNILHTTKENINKDIEKILKNNKDIIIYTSVINTNIKKEIPKNYSCLFNSQADICIWQIRN